VVPDRARSQLRTVGNRCISRYAAHKRRF
jgi:hypothetical protein